MAALARVIALCAVLLALAACRDTNPIDRAFTQTAQASITSTITLTPTATSTATPSLTPSSTTTITPSPTQTPTATSTPTTTPAFTASAEPTASATPGIFEVATTRALTPTYSSLNPNLRLATWVASLPTPTQEVLQYYVVEIRAQVGINSYDAPSLSARRLQPVAFGTQFIVYEEVKNDFLWLRIAPERWIPTRPNWYRVLD